MEDRGIKEDAVDSETGRQFVVIASGSGKIGTYSGGSYSAFALPGVGAGRKVIPIEEIT
jgi:hypothetical protein